MLQGVGSRMRPCVDILFLVKGKLFDGGGTSCRCINERRPMEEKQRFV